MFKSLNPKLDFFGLDISDASLKFAKASKTEESIKLSSFGKKELKSGIVKKGRINDEDLLATEIKNLIKRKLETKYVAISLPEEKAFFQIIETPKVKENRLKKIIEYEAEDYIPFSIDEVYLDFEIVDERKKSFNVLITAIPKKIIKPYISVVKKAGLFPVVAEVESISLVRSLVKNKEQTSPLLLIDIGETKTILTILSRETIIFTSYILTSSKDLTKKIAQDNDISLAEAEKIKINHGIQSEERKDIEQSLLPLLEETVETIQKHLAYYNSCGFSFQTGGEAEKIENIILCGGGANLKGLPNFLSERLNIKVTKGDPFVNFSEKTENKFSEDSLSYGVALGLALRNFDKNNL
ncbi:MAG: type IV pilus assembly protein PilM [Patescibacteria group bacterium]